MIYFISYIILGVIIIIGMAYDPYSKKFDWGLSDGWEFWWWQRYLAWAIVIVFAPYYFCKVIYGHFSERKYVKQWRKHGRFKRKL